MTRLIPSVVLVMGLAAPSVADVTVKANGQAKAMAEMSHQLGAELFAPPAGHKIKEQK